MGTRQIDDTEIDDLGGVVLHYKNVAGFDIAMHQALLVRGLQAPANLRDDGHHPLHRQPRARSFNQFGKRSSRKQRHHEEGLLHAMFVDFPYIANVDDVGMADAGQHAPFLAKQLNRKGIGDIPHGLERHRTLGFDVNGAINYTHPAFTEKLFDLVPVGD